MRTIRLKRSLSIFSIGIAGSISLGCATFSDVHAQEIKTPSDMKTNSLENTSQVTTKDKLISGKQKASQLFQVSQAPSSPPENEGNKPQNATPEKKEAAKVETEKPNRFALSADFFHRFYREEEIIPGFKSDEFGSLIGGQADYDYVKGNSVYFGASLRYAGGNTTYDGGIQTPLLEGGLLLTPAKSTTSNRFLNINARVGYTFKVGLEDRLLLTPFIGIGYNRWERDVLSIVSPLDGNTIPTFFSNYSWTTIDLGLKSEYKLSPKFDIGLNLKVLLPGNGQVSTIRSPLGNRTQYEVELPLTYHLTESSIDAFDIKLTPYYRSQDIGRSGVDIINLGNGFLQIAQEPNSTTAVYGATLGVVYKFQPFGGFSSTATTTPAVTGKPKDSLRYN